MKSRGLAFKLAVPLFGLVVLAGTVFLATSMIKSWWGLPFPFFKVQAEQPINFPHNLHTLQPRTVVDGPVGDPKTQISLEDALKIDPHTKAGSIVGAGIDCQFCHRLVADTEAASLPAVQQCYFCHQKVRSDAPEVTKILSAYENGDPLNWVRVHRLPDHVQFVHDSHIRFFSEQNKIAPSQVCSICHGDVSSMTIDHQVRTLKMGDCVDCHRSGYLGYLAQDAKTAIEQAVLNGTRKPPPTDCAACHY
ncbi:MAG: hypothetical protein HY261_02185 [Chloroflexi bacterium]|nr:hypothetical protein [Chloroflexota bacterium]